MGNLLYWAVVFLIVALVAAALGFGSVAGVAIEGARMLFWVAIVLFVVALVGGLIRRGSATLADISFVSTSLVREEPRSIAGV